VKSNFDEGNYTPRFELVTFADPGGLAGSAAEPLIVDGVPKSFIASTYLADDSLEFLESPSRGALVSFGTSRSTRICVDPKTGEVVQLIGTSPTKEIPVNRNLDRFSRCVEAVIDRFPFYSEQQAKDGDDIVTEVSAELRDLIREIDPEYLVQNYFWDEFIWDVEAGDYCTEG
jgi:hypothetical protein